MTTLTINIEEGHEQELKELLRTAPFKAEVIGDKNSDLLAEPTTQYQRIMSLLKQAEGKDLFKSIEDPSEWQREIRKEWDRDL